MKMNIGKKQTIYRITLSIFAVLMNYAASDTPSFTIGVG